MAVTRASIDVAMGYVAAMAIEEIAEIEHIGTTEACERFLSSRTAETLFDDSRKLWWDGPSAVSELYLEEVHGTKGAR